MKASSLTPSTNSSAPLVSIIVPVYNVEQYLEDTLNSVCSQTLTNIEVICINDGSSDNSLEILKQHAARDSRIVIIDKDNTGVGDSRNVGISAAKGEYIAFLDSDDMFFDVGVLELLYSKAKESGCMICGGNPAKLTNGELCTTPFGRYPAMFFKEEGIVNYDDFQFNYGFYNYIYKRELLTKNEIKFPHFKRYQDPPFMVKAMHTAKTFYAINRSVYTYRVEHKTIEWNEAKVNDLYAAFQETWNFAVAHNLEKLKEYVWQQMKDHKARTLSKMNTQHKQFMDDVSKYIDSTNTVSVVIPVYNAEPYLREAMDSVVNQTHKLLEIICVNDGSRDCSLNILKEYAERDKRIKIIDKENGGYGKAMNSGLKIATGKYFAILEPDDTLPLDAYEHLVLAAENAAADIAKGCLSDFVGNGSNRKTTWRSTFGNEFLNRIITPRNERKIFRAVMNTVTAIYRMDMIRKFDICYNESPGASYQDNSLYMLGFAYADRLVCTNEIVYNYRRDNENSSVNAVNGKIGAHRQVYDFIRQRLERTPEIWNTMKAPFLLRRMQSHSFIYEKMSNALKLSYLESFREELIQMEDFDNSMLSMKEKWDMTTILQSPTVYILVEAMNLYPGGIKKQRAAKPATETEQDVNSLFYRRTPTRTTYKLLGIPMYSIRRKGQNKIISILGIPIIKQPAN